MKNNLAEEPPDVFCFAFSVVVKISKLMEHLTVLVGLLNLVVVELMSHLGALVELMKHLAVLNDGADETLG